MGGTPSRSWRSEAASAGPVGIFGTGRNFLTITRSGSYKGQWAGVRFETKTPFITEGHEPVTLSISPPDRSRARLQAPTSPPWVPQLEVRFIPCPDQPRTAWPAGFLLHDRRPITLIVRRPGDPDRQLRVGRV